MFAFEAYEESPDVILDREVEKWSSELTGTIDVDRFDVDQLTSEVAAYVYLAVIGTSRLPITSLESPLPALSLGQLSYSPRLNTSAAPFTDSISFASAAFDRNRPVSLDAKALETALRSIDPSRVAELATVLVSNVIRRRDSAWLEQRLCALFNGVALSPYTQFVDRLAALLEELAQREEIGPAACIDICGYMLRHLVRHLTAFDLRVFHNSGAIFPTRSCSTRC